MKTYFVGISASFWQEIYSDIDDAFFSWDKISESSEVVKARLNVQQARFIVNGVRQLCNDDDIYQIAVESESELSMICLRLGITVVPNEVVMEYVNFFNKHHLLLEQE